ncbi:MAG: HlyC/CorC family transporter [Clostridia bacterium]|nr:HlyC/CorC family transporter [Clostridia bacterium]
MTAVIAVLVMFSAFFSAAETAYSSVSKVRMKNYAENGSKKAKKALDIIEHYDKALSTILVGNNIVNIASSALATLLFVSFLGDAVGTLVSTIVITVVVLICGEVLPKNYAIENSEKICMATASVLYFLIVILTPVTFLLLKLKDMFVSVMSKNKGGDKTPTVTEDELKYIVESIEEEGVLEEQESELVQSALDFDEKTAYDILTPRVDMVAVDIQDSCEEILDIIVSERYSRIPVYRDNIDNIIGVLHTRDYLEAMLKDEPVDLEKLIQPAYFIYRSKKLSSLLADFKYKRLHLAVVTDDYGGTLGIVTMEDLLEQLVGDIWDEDEEVEHKFKKLSENEYEISGDMNIDDMLELVDKDDRYIDSDSKSVGGWVIEQIGDIPDKGSQFRYKELFITVKDVEDQRVNSVIMVYKPEAVSD